MRRILHLSDLHFGRVHDDLIRPLTEAVNTLAPDLVAISGDFTQRARIAQFEEARRFVEGLNPPVVAVPGNHDTPLDNLLIRFFAPWRRYRRYISRDLEPVVRDAEFTLVGINTVNRFSWQRGRIGRHTLARVGALIGGDDRERMQIAMLHHPLDHLPEVEKRLMRGARRAIRMLGEKGADIVLSGHLHNTRVAPLEAQPDVLFVQAGTGLSSRVRGEANMFNLLTIDGPRRLTVERYAAEPGAAFEKLDTAGFEKGPEGWTQDRRAAT